MKHYIMFSEGSYSDYSVGGLYECDHVVKESEWHEFYQEWQAELDELREAVYAKFGYAYYQVAGYEDSQQWKAYKEFREISPEDLFQKMHNMQQLEVNEFWRDC